MEELDLTQMVKESEEVNKTEQTLDLPEESETINENQEVVAEETTNTPSQGISFSMILDWFDKHANSFENVKRIKAKLAGVDGSDNLLFSVLSPKGGVDSEGNAKRELHLYKGCKNIIVPDVNPLSFEVYSNGFMTSFDANGIIIKCYTLKTFLIMIYCKRHNDRLLPFFGDKVAKSSNGYIIKNINLTVDDINSKLTKNADMESLNIKYPQIRKAVNAKTNNDIINWIEARKQGLYDVNHLLQLDNLIVGIME